MSKYSYDHVCVLYIHLNVQNNVTHHISILNVNICKYTLMCIVENLGVFVTASSLKSFMIMILLVVEKRCVKRLNKDDSPSE